MTGIDSDSGGLRQPPTAPINKKAALFGKYELGKLLGCGAFAKVYHARNLQSGQGVAIKVIDKKKMAPAMASNVKREVSVMRRLRHSHIVKLFEVLATKSKIYLVLEFAKGGELFARVAKGRFSEDLSRRYFRQLISAVGFCHSRGVFHRDLKPENLLLDESGRLKVSDFGLSADVHQQREDALLRTLCGTPAYVAPEILAKKGYDGAKVDVWSCGVILFVLNAGFLPFNDPNLMVMYKKIYKGDFRCPKWMSSDLKRFLSRLLDTNPDTRITVDEILRDPWFRKGGGHEEATNFHRGEDNSKDEGMKKRREKNTPLNAFDIISFSSGLDLSGLFDASCNSVDGGERFVATETPEAMMEKIEGLANSEEGLRVRKDGESGFLLEGAKGEFQIGIEVYRLTEGLVVVEATRRSGDAGSFNEAWKNRLRPQLTGA